MQRDTAIAERDSMVRLHRKRAPMACQRFAVSSEIMQGDPAIGQRLDIVRLHRKRVIVAVQRLGGLL